MKKLEKPIFVAQPILPKIELLNEQISEIFESKWLTNMGVKHAELEEKLTKVLKVENVSLFNNGTIALLVALKALGLPVGSEVITTPFTFPATPHCISWNGLNPVFCDIEPKTMCIDPDKIEALITPKTSAIVGVHVYGFPCNVEKIEKIAKKHNLKVIYDGAHVFSTEISGRGIGSFGDVTMFSFHATKLFNSIEGGCLAYNDNNLVRKIYNLRNFGIQSEELVEEVGINGKMNEVQAIFGLLNLNIYKEEQAKRALIKEIYDKNLTDVKGITVPKMPPNVTNSYQYYPIIVEDDYGISRNEMYDKFKELNVMTRKYFYPLCSDYECYKHLASSKPEHLPVANLMKNQVLCLPFHSGVSLEIAEDIANTIRRSSF